MTPWDPEVLARIAHLHLRARQATAGLLHGGHRSDRVSANVEFADYKEYSPGDPLRDLDWKVAARSDRLVVRRHHAETELRGLIVLDASGDLGTGETGRYKRPPIEGSKFGYALALVASLAWFLERQGEPVGLLLLGGAGARTSYVPPGSGQSHMAEIFGALAEVRPSGRADLERGLREVGGRLSRRALVVLVSDFMEEPERWAPSMNALGQRRADIRAVQLFDQRELSLDYDEPLRFTSPETGLSLPVDPVGARDAFREVVDEYLSEVRAAFARMRGHHVLAGTHEPLDRVLARVLRV